MDFLRDELGGLPPMLAASLLSQIEEMVRQSRFVNVVDGHRLDLRCIQLCSSLKAILDTASRFKSLRDDTLPEG